MLQRRRTDNPRDGDLGPRTFLHVLSKHLTLLDGRSVLGNHALLKLDAVADRLLTQRHLDLRGLVEMKRSRRVVHGLF